MSSASTRQLRAIALILLSAVGFGSISIITVFATRDGLPLLSVMFWRYLLALAVIAFLAGRALRHPLRRWLPLMAIAGPAQAAVTYVSLSSLRFISPAALAFLFFTFPAWITIALAVTGRERVTWRRGTAVVLALAGVGVMVGVREAALDWRGVLLALAASFIYAAYVPTLARLQQGFAPFAMSFYVVAGAVATFLPIGLVTGTLATPALAQSWAAVATLAIGSTVIAFATFFAGLRVLGPVVTSIVATAEPFFTTVLAAVALGQAIELSVITGGALIAAAVVLIFLESPSGKPAATDPAAGSRSPDSADRSG